ncbi:MAG: nuclease [Syntrophales bacterium]
MWPLIFKSRPASSWRNANLYKKGLCFCVLLFLLIPLAFGWGKDGHLYINKVAVQKIPNELPAFLAKAAEQIIYLAPEPDRWREASEYTLKNSQEPDHFIDLEKLAGFGELPKGRYTYYKRLYEKRASMTQDRDDWLPESIGLLPYITIEVYDRLKVAFREYRTLQESGQSTGAVEKDVVFYAGWLSHYVGDGSQPMHVTIHHHGWVGDNPNGYSTDHNIHSDFETRFVSQNITPQGFADLVHAPTRLEHPFEDFMDYLRESNKQVERLYQIYKNQGFEGSGSKEALEFTNGRLAAASQMLLNLWYTAWLESTIQNR